jgi:two-component system cell cycle sensor histidine kinase/response regulator CckA
VFDAASSAGGLILYIRDKSNENNLEQQVVQAQKMQAFGQMAGGVAHDFNNLLTAIIGYCDLLIQRHGVGDPSFSDLMQVKQNANRAASLARQMLTISRKQPLNPKLMNVAEAFMEAEHLISRFVGEKIKVKINCAPGIGNIRFDPVQFSQVMINLAINARDAMDGKGVLTISSRSEHLSESYHFGTSIINPGDFVVISVSDTGCGISPENLTRIFEPFYTTKKHTANSGTGLGLAMVYGIIHQTGGFIKVSSELGKGTNFELYLPEFADETENAENIKQQEEIIRNKDGSAVLTTIPATSADEKPILGMNISKFDSHRSFALNPENTRILFVDDEDAVRSVGARGLKRKGFDVVDCISAENALEYLDKGEKFDMLITDMMMPGMSGADLAKVVQKRLPDIKIILASGYSEEIARKELAGSQDFYFMSKPYSLGDLTKKVMEVADQK